MFARFAFDALWCVGELAATWSLLDFVDTNVSREGVTNSSFENYDVICDQRHGDNSSKPVLDVILLANRLPHCDVIVQHR